ncbi:gamma-glutamylcyclotransferase family protein [Hasllibacter halocynthiae]|nr:gamma-glutamylcyclotransferase family protein [Hasllibacter halocynthiae]
MAATGTARIFGYGSLVNGLTHRHGDLVPAGVRGWRRGWCATGRRGVAFLSVQPDGAAECLGATIGWPLADLSALDAREAAYERREVDAGGGAILYAVPDADRLPAGHGRPILLSYLDAVIQGFARLHGPADAWGFFETTDGWGPVRDDRAAPLYPRACVLTAEETALVDEGLARLGLR